ncbi:MAG: PIN domain-containing protein [Thermodesulfobacteriota bacterium]
MRAVFADTAYWVALFHPDDALHQKAAAVNEALKGAVIVTSDMVLTEFLNHFAKHGPQFRSMAASTVKALLGRSDVKVVPQTRLHFKEAVDLYNQRPDKDWGLTDCSSFVIMKEMNIKASLTHDFHFVQAGFRALLRDED